jgi:hypothetical protein
LFGRTAVCGDSLCVASPKKKARRTIVKRSTPIPKTL